MPTTIVSNFDRSPVERSFSESMVTGRPSRRIASGTRSPVPMMYPTLTGETFRSTTRTSAFDGP